MVRLESTLPATLVVDGGSLCCGFGFALSLLPLKDELVDLFMRLLTGCTVGFGTRSRSNG